MKNSSCPRSISTLVVVWVFGLSLANATTLLKNQELPELVAQSERALLAEIVSVEYGYDENRLPSTVVLLRVEDAIYGETLPAAGELVRIKLFGAPATMEDGLRFFVSGTPVYRPGERYLLLLIGDSEWGFTNTVGLPFGAFRIRSEGGGALATSVAGNHLALGAGGLRTWLPESLRNAQLPDKPTQAVPYPLLRGAIEDLWIQNGGTLRGAP